MLQPAPPAHLAALVVRLSVARASEGAPGAAPSSRAALRARMARVAPAARMVPRRTRRLRGVRVGAGGQRASQAGSWAVPSLGGAARLVASEEARTEPAGEAPGPGKARASLPQRHRSD
ncbi:MAG: hypothetical protein ABR537_11330 [Gemmatimonadales bacterium]